MIVSNTKYQCVAGETFDSIALMVYKNEKYAADIMTANPLLITVPIFKGGERLNLPVIEMETQANTDAPWKE